MTIEEQVLLSELTTFHIGGPARYLVRVDTTDALREALDFAQEKSFKVLILGGGSNILASDEGYEGLVIKIEVEGVELRKEGDTTLLIAGAGESWDGLVGRAVKENLWGIENLSGIPGTVGGAVAGSIGAYGQAVSQTVQWVEVLDVESREVKKLFNQECEFSYRKSIFKSGKYIVLRAAFALSNTPDPNLSYVDPTKAYKDLARVLAANASPTLADIRAAIRSIRADKFPDLSKEATAGSFFKNLIVPQAQAQELAKQYPGLPLFPMPETPGHTKVPIAWLMDRVLHMHGSRIGNARLFEKQILVIVAPLGTSSADVRSLAQFVEKKVFDELKLKIEPEVRILS